MAVLHLQDLRLGAGDALIVVDVQHDFLPGGALGVARGDEVLEPLRRAIEAFARRSLPIFATRDWHPPNHVSFRDRGGPWPPHCVRGTPGAEITPALGLPPTAVVVSKGAEPDADAYSGFQGTPLKEQLRARSVKHVFIGGLATDYCVLNTVRDALDRDFAVALLMDAIRAVDVQPGDGDRAIAEMLQLGAVPVEAGPYHPATIPHHPPRA